MKLVHLIGFYYKEICYDARSRERKIRLLLSVILMTIAHVSLDLGTWYLLVRLCFKALLERTHCRNKGADKSLARPGRKQATATEDVEFHVSYL